MTEDQHRPLSAQVAGNAAAEAGPGEPTAAPTIERTPDQNAVFTPDAVAVPTTGAWLVINGVVHECARAYVNDVTETGREWRVDVDDA